MKTIGIIGCGNLGLSLSKGFLVNPNLRILANRRNPISVTLDRFEWASVEDIIEKSDIVILALKPYAIDDFFAQNGQIITSRNIPWVSVVSGLTYKKIQLYLSLASFPFVRAMPNTAAEVSESMTALSFHDVTSDQKTEIKKLFKLIGNTLEINEDLMEAATIIGACGIAYVLRFMRAMIQGGVEVGFDAKTATEIVSQTVKGAAQLIIENKTHPEEEIDKVTTPKGCTIVGLNTMEHSGFSSALIKGIVESYRKIEN
jgi:pyrroline-5-carboxylate reductase